MQRVAYLDGWRGLAILFVLVDHFARIPGFKLGSFGVELFFVLSGRLMAELLVVQDTPWRTFLWRRFSRIYPALLVLCTAMLIFSHSSLYPAYAPKVSAGEYGAALLFAMNYAARFRDHVIILDHTWSLCVEEHSYLLLVLLVLAVSRFRRGEPHGGESRAQVARQVGLAAGLIGVAMILSGIVQAQFFDPNATGLYWRTDVRAGSVLMSFALYLALRPLQMRQQGAGLPSWLPTATFLIALSLQSELFPVWITFSLGTLALAVCVNTIDFASEPVRSALSARWITSVGMISYSLYLWQQPFFKFSDVLSAPVSLAGSFAVAAISYVLIEKPSRAFLNRLWTRRKTIGQTELR